MKDRTRFCLLWIRYSSGKITTNRFVFPIVFLISNENEKFYSKTQNWSQTSPTSHTTVFTIEYNFLSSILSDVQGIKYIHHYFFCCFFVIFTQILIILKKLIWDIFLFPYIFQLIIKETQWMIKAFFVFVHSGLISLGFACVINFGHHCIFSCIALWLMFEFFTLILCHIPKFCHIFQFI